MLERVVAIDVANVGIPVREENGLLQQEWKSQAGAQTNFCASIAFTWLATHIFFASGSVALTRDGQNSSKQLVLGLGLV